MSVTEALMICDDSYKDFFTDENKALLENIFKDISSDTFFPDVYSIFLFARTPIKDIKCVFLGMEPYASWFMAGDSLMSEATGRSFEVRSVSDWNQKFKQSSLRNILKSLYYLHTGQKESLGVIREKINNGEFSLSPPHVWFDKMEEQGVIFLNASLTVKKDIPNSHKILWEEFTTRLIEYINYKNPHIKWILAGNQAQEKALNLTSNSIATHHPRLDNFVVECPFKYVREVNWIR